MPRLLLFLVVAGVVIYALVWLIQRAQRGNDSGGPVGPPAPPPPPPDDDPVFLAQLDRRLRQEREAREAEARERLGRETDANEDPEGRE